MLQKFQVSKDFNFKHYSFFFNVCILLKSGWLTLFQVHSKVIQLYKYTYIIFEIIFHHKILTIIP